MAYKLGTWKRYKCEGEKELFKFLGYEQHYEQATKYEATITVEKTQEGARETYQRGDYKLVSNITGEKYDQISVDFGSEKVTKLSGDGTEKDRVEFEMGGFKRIHEREYKGTHEFVATSTLMKGDESVVLVEYYRKV